MRRISGVLTSIFFLMLVAPVFAEPYLAVQTGFQCVQCHVNPTGGGLRNAYGNAFAQTVLAARQLDIGSAEPWTGTIGNRLAIGGNFRANYRFLDIPNQSHVSEFETEGGRVFADFTLIPGRLFLYMDEQVIPGAATNLEANLRFWMRENRLYVKAGRLYLPFGWRLEDDSALVRQLSGIGMTTPDNGFEVGVQSTRWSAQLAATNGSAGGSELDSGKQLSLRTEYGHARWRLGFSANHNDSDAGKRLMFGAHAGIRTGPISWLGEIDYVDDDSLAAEGRKLLAGLGEINWLMQQGHNLKLGFEYLDPNEDTQQDEQSRISLIYELTPMQFLQLRLGARIYDDVQESDLENRRLFFVQLHGFF